MNKFCNDVNAINTLYELKCISLKYDESTKMYYVYEEVVDTDANGALLNEADDPDKSPGRCSAIAFITICT